jgi:hypothetical protein
MGRSLLVRLNNRTSRPGSPAAEAELAFCGPKRGVRSGSGHDSRMEPRRPRWLMRGLILLFLLLVAYFVFLFIYGFIYGTR